MSKSIATYFFTLAVSELLSVYLKLYKIRNGGLQNHFDKLIKIRKA